MRASAVSFAHNLAVAALAALLTFALPTVSAFAEVGSQQIAESENAENSSGAGKVEGAFGSEVPPSPQPPSASLTETGTLAESLIGKPASFVSSDVVLDGEPIIGSFTVDGLTFAVIDGPYVELVGVSPGWQQATDPQERESSKAASALAGPITLGGAAEGGEAEGPDEGHASEAGAAGLVLPETVSYEGVSHIVSSVGAYAFYLSGVTDVTLPASVSDVDERAFRSSDVANMAVAEGNPNYSSYDGALYDADQSSLLLIPEGRKGAVVLPKTAEKAEAGVFSHCPLVEAISVEDGSAAFASENGLLYTSDLTTLLRVPAGATEITIREGCTTIAAGAMEACAKLTTINAPSTVASISPDVFTAIPTVSLLAASLTGTDYPGAPGEPTLHDAIPQITAAVSLRSVDSNLPKLNPASIQIKLAEGADAALWQSVGFNIGPLQTPPSPGCLFTPGADLQAINTSSSAGFSVKVETNGHNLQVRQWYLTPSTGGVSNQTTAIVASADTQDGKTGWFVGPYSRNGLDFWEDEEISITLEQGNENGYWNRRYSDAGNAGYRLSGFSTSPS